MLQFHLRKSGYSSYRCRVAGKRKFSPFIDHLATSDCHATQPIHMCLIDKTITLPILRRGSNLRHHSGKMALNVTDASRHICALNNRSSEPMAEVDSSRVPTISICKLYFRTRSSPRSCVVPSSPFPVNQGDGPEVFVSFTSGSLLSSIIANWTLCLVQHMNCFP